METKLTGSKGQTQVNAKDMLLMTSFFKTIGDETRLKIIFSLFQADLCVNDIALRVSMTKSAVSHQLRILKEEALVKSHKEGKNVFYSLDDEHVADVVEKALVHVRHKHEAND